MDIQKYWQDVLNQDPESIKRYFVSEAYINWHNSNEHFTVDEFIKANCEYPGQWAGEIERTEIINGTIITVSHVWEKTHKISFHVTSFININNNKIQSVDEYWGEDTPAPQWRLEKMIGTAIK